MIFSHYNFSRTSRSNLIALHKLVSVAHRGQVSLALGTRLSISLSLSPAAVVARRFAERTKELYQTLMHTCSPSSVSTIDVAAGWLAGWLLPTIASPLSLSHDQHYTQTNSMLATQIESPCSFHRYAAYQSPPRQPAHCKGKQGINSNGIPFRLDPEKGGYLIGTDATQIAIFISRERSCTLTLSLSLREPSLGHSGVG